MSAQEIDLSDPWRYRCPECDSTQLHQRVGGVHSFDDQRNVPRYFCDHCQTSLTELFDCKEDTTVTVGTLAGSKRNPDENINRMHIGADPYPGATPEHCE